MEAVYASPEFGIAGSWLAEYTLTGLDAGVVVFDAGGQAAQWNRAAAHLLGVPEETLAGRRLADPELALVGGHGAPLAAADDPVGRVLADAEPVRATIGVITLDGGPRWRRIDVLPVFGVDRHPRAALATIVEGPADRDARDDRWQSTTRALLHTDLVAHIVVDRSGSIVDWNQRCLELVGRGPDDLRGRHLTEVCDIDLDWVHQQLTAGRQQQVGGITWAIHRDGGEIAVIARFVAVDWPAVGRAVVAQLLDTGSFAATVPVTAAHPDARVFTHAHTPMLMISQAGDVVGANRAALSLLDAHVVDLVGRPLPHCLAGLDPVVLRRAIAEADLTETTATLGTYLARTTTGEAQMVSTTVTTLGRDGGTAHTLLVQLTVLRPALDRQAASPRTPRHG